MYQYFLPEGDLTEASLLQHLQRMAQVPQVKASAVKVSLDLAAHVAGVGCPDRVLALEKRVPSLLTAATSVTSSS